MKPRLVSNHIDRNALLRRDPIWLADAWRRADVLLVDPDRQTVSATEEGLTFISSSDTLPQRRIYLGGDNQPYFAVISELPDGLYLREAHPGWSDHDLGLATEALAMAQWHNLHRFHPRTGEALEPRSAGWELGSESGVVYPRIDPAVIVLIDDGDDRVLLARNVAARNGRYACVAGFVEPGESAEAAVHREVAEETGLQLQKVDYVTSQPWPFPSSLMLAFSATADPSQEINVQLDELADARWFTSQQAAEHISLRGDSVWRGMSQVSVAWFLIERWLNSRT